MIRLPIILAATILFSQAAQAEGPKAVGTPEDVRLRDEYGACTFEAAERLLDTDDRAFVVAEDAHLACKDEWSSWVNYHLANDENHDGVELMFASVEDHYMQGLTALIIEMRATSQ